MAFGNDLTKLSELSKNCDFTAASLEIISLAKSECRRSQNNFLGSKLLLYGILKQEKNIVANYLHLVSDSLVEEICDEIEQWREATSSSHSPEQIVLTDNALEILTNSSYALDKLVSKRTPELIMLGILDRPDCGAIQVLLENDDINLEELRSLVIKEVRALDLELIGAAERLGVDSPVKSIQIITLPQEDGRWVCTINGLAGLYTFLEYGDTEQMAMARALRDLARVLEMSVGKVKTVRTVNSI